MTVQRARLEAHRDQALRDIVELDRQIADGEIPLTQADGLRSGYEHAAAQAIAALDSAHEPEPTQPRPRSRGRMAAYALTTIAAVFAVVVLLPDAVGQRPAGGFVTGNEVTEGARGAPPTRDLSTVTDAEVEAVLEANPEVVGMRLALANRYAEKGDYDRAAGHYTTALRQEPDNPEAQAHFGWLLLQVDRPQQALRMVDRALDTDPAMLDALWFKANIALHGLDDPARARAVLETMAQRGDLSPTVRRQVSELIAVARQQEAGQR